MARRIPVVALSCLLLVMAAIQLASPNLVVAAEKKAKTESVAEFTATYVNMDAPGGNMATPCFIKIKAWSTDAQVEALLKVLQEKGQTALLNAMGNMETGYFQLQGSLGYPIAVARMKKTDAGQTIMLVSNRPFAGVSQVTGGQAADYPFGVVELTIDANGKGTGQIVGYAQVDISKENQVSIKSMGTMPSRLMEVKKK